MEATGGHTIRLRHQGWDRTYRLRVPSVALTRSVPLVVEIHGRGIGADAFDRMTGFGSLADQAGFALAMPSAVGKVWNDGRYPRLARDGPTTSPSSSL